MKRDFSAPVPSKTGDLHKRATELWKHRGEPHNIDYDYANGGCLMCGNYIPEVIAPFFCKTCIEEAPLTSIQIGKWEQC